MTDFKYSAAFDDGALHALINLKNLIFPQNVDGVKAKDRVEELKGVLDRLIQCEPERNIFMQTETVYFWKDRIEGKKAIKEQFTIKRKT